MSKKNKKKTIPPLEEISKSGVTVRFAAWEVLLSVSSGAYADLALERIISKYPLSQFDRALLTELAYGAIRYRFFLDCWINYLAKLPVEKQPPLLRWLLHIGLYQILKMKKVPKSAAVNTTVEIAKASNIRKLAPVVNAILRKAIRVLDNGGDLPPLSTISSQLAQKHSLPEWLIDKLIVLRGEKGAESVAKASNRLPSSDLRVNRQKIDLSSLQEIFSENRIPVIPIPGRLDGLEIKSGLGNVQTLPGYEQGLWSVQDRSSQWVSPLLEPEPGNRILDACAAPGGKTTHLAELIEDKGEVWAIDRSAKRLKRVAENASRLELSSIRCFASDALNLTDRRPEWKGYFHRILIDAPCSGLGTLSRHPDARWRMSPEKIEELVILQSKLLERVLPLLNQGGKIVYSTCTFHPEENHRQIENFLALHSQLKLRFEKQIWPDDSLAGDGFYAAVMDLL